VILSFTAPASPAQEADTVPRPDVFSGNASSLVASVQIDRDALLPVEDLFRFIALDGLSTYETSSQTARASLLFPGNGLVLGPSLLCGQFGGQFPPEFKPFLDTCLQYKYPLIADADSFNPDAATTGALTMGGPLDPVSATALGATAHAGEDAATTEASMADLRVNGLLGLEPLGLLPLGQLPLGDLTLDTSILRIDDATSRTDQRIDHGVLHVDAESTLSGLHLLGGLVQIGGVRSQSHVTDDGAGKRTAASSLEITGVSVGGIPAQITEQGLVLGSPTGVLGPLVQQLQTQVNSLLQALGFRLVALETTQTLKDEDNNAAATAQGLLIEFSANVAALPTLPLPSPVGEVDPNGTYSGSIQIGATGVKGQAASFDDDAFVEAPFEGGTGDYSGDGGASFDSGSFDLPSVTPDVIAAPAQPATPTARPRLTAALPDLFGGRLGFLYLACMFAALGLAIVPVVAVPARLPGPRS
jgi:hypothetical protein